MLVVAILTACVPAQAADPAVRPLSPAWFGTQATSGLGGASGQTSSQASHSAVQQSLANLAAAAKAVNAMRGVQSQARSAASALVFGGPQPSAAATGDGLGAGALQPANSASWQNAAAPEQTSASGRTKVAIRQTGQQALLNWSSFNVGSGTDLVFDQSAGGAAASTWVALNRVTDPAMRPSQILGSITAPGQVYVINRNGIIFGGQSQVNVGALLAGTADFTGAGTGFPANGLYGAGGVSGLPTLGGSADTMALPGSAVIVQPGARITTAAPGSVTSRGGFVMLLGGKVDNAGSIATPQGQTVLAAGISFVLAKGYSSTGGGDALATTLGAQVAVNSGGAASNSGLIEADRGDITLVGRAVTQAGVAVSTSTTSQRGTIHLLTATADTGASVTLAPGSLTRIVPELDNTDTAFNSQRATLIATSATNNAARQGTAASLNNVANLADQLAQSRIEVTSGGAVTFGAESLTMAQAGQIAVSAGSGRITAERTAKLDVSGVVGLSLPVSGNILTINIQPTILRDSPANRDSGKLAGKNVYVDSRNLTFVAASRADTTDRYYTPGGLLEVGGYLSNVGHTVGEWSTVGGTVTLAAGQVVVQRDAGINLAGGSIAYQGGMINTSWFTGSNGQIYTASAAPSSMTLTGVYSGFTVANAKWGISRTFTNPLVGFQSTYAAGYEIGRDAGALIVSAPTVVLDGQVRAGVVTGSTQTAARPASVADSFTLSQSVAPLGGALELGAYQATGLTGAYATNVRLGAAPGLAAYPGPSEPLPSARLNTAWLPQSLFDGSGLASLQVASLSNAQILAPLNLSPGGQVGIVAPNLLVAADINAPAATISLGNQLSVTKAFLTSPVTATSPVSASVMLVNNARINAGGLWNNRLLDPFDATGAGFVSAGSVTLDSSRGVTLQAGTSIDVSAGGALSPTGALTGGKGGSVKLIANDPNAGSSADNAALVLAGTLSGFGATGGGALSIIAPNLTIAPDRSALTVPTSVGLSLTPGFFNRGFTSYSINGTGGVTVARNTDLAVVVPSYVRSAGASALPTGADPAAAYSLALAPLFTPNLAKATLTQRPGASLSLQSSSGLTGGALSIGDGASITVDPGQSISLSAFDQMTIAGQLSAPGGSVSIINSRYQDGTNDQLKALYDPTLAVWLGPQSRIDVAGIRASALDNRGRPFGQVLAGGAISIGGVSGTSGDGTQRTTALPIIIRPGAVLDASGTSARVNPLAGLDPLANGLETTPLALSRSVVNASAGGSITLSSYSGIYADGVLRAASGGASAAGGLLSLSLETPVYGTFRTQPPAELLVPRIMTIAQHGMSLLPGGMELGSAVPKSAYGRVWLGADQIAAGGFGSASLSARGLLQFDGDVTLRASQSISLNKAVIADTSPRGRVLIEAPYVSLGGLAALVVSDSEVSSQITANWRAPATAGTGALTVSAGQIDLFNDLRFGTASAIPVYGTPTTTTGTTGFNQLTLKSTGDIRFLNGALSGTGKTTILSDGDITLKAAQIYPASGVVATVLAGYDYHATSSTNGFAPSGRLEIDGNGAVPDAPYSTGGQLTLAAGTVVQKGVVRAPLGNIVIGVNDTAANLFGGASKITATTGSVILADGSLTSVSAAGLTIPYGGTTDGITYAYNGGQPGQLLPQITLGSRSVQANAGAVLDLSGGGVLAGGAGELASTSSSGVATLISQGFIAGRGGSTDVLTTPLLQFSAATTAAQPSLASNPVYALLPGFDAGYMPVTPLDQSASFYGSLPALGRQVTIGAGVAGLAAGTYTLLPSTYALLPGAYRIELSASPARSQSAVAAGYGVYSVPVTIGLAGTRIRSQTPVQGLVMSGATARQYSQYDEQTYSDFNISQAATYSRARPILPQDAGTLVLNYPAVSSRVAALNFAGTANFAPAPSGYGGTVVVTADASSTIELTNGVTPGAAKSINISASSLNDLQPSRMVIGGTISYVAGTSASATVGSVLLNSSAGRVIVDAGATLVAPDVFLTAATGAINGGIVLRPGAVINTIGQGAPSYDTAATGLPIDAQRHTALLVSNGFNSLSPINTSLGPSSGPIRLEDGSLILASGSIIGSTENSVSIGPQASFGAAAVTFSVPVVNIGTPADPNVPVPAGLTLTSASLARLLQADAATGKPALSTLNLTASRAVEFYGSIAFAAIGGTGGLQTLRLDTPAIYGQGSSLDTARIAVNTLIWNGVPASGSSTGSALPQGVVANGAGTGTGSLSIETGNLIFGYADGVAPISRTILNRTIAGFENVAISASQSIGFNNAGTLSVWSRQTGVGSGGVGGNLSLVTPIITAGGGASLAVTAGGAILVAPPTGGGPNTGAQTGQGAALTLNAASIDIGTSIVLNAGSIAVTATAGDVRLEPGARLDVSGPSVTLFDRVVASDGGSVRLESRGGNVLLAENTLVDVSAPGASAGSLSVTSPAGISVFAGALSGGASDSARSGRFTLQTRGLDDFAALNARLDAGAFNRTRHFDIGAGDLAISGTIRAHDVAIAASGGSLALFGTIDASGAAPGQIALAARDALTLAAGSALNAGGTEIQTDSSGAVIAASNRATVSIEAGTGLLTLGAGAVIDVSNPSGLNLGTVSFYAPRRRGDGGLVNDIAIDASGAPSIRGAASIAVYGMASTAGASQSIAQSDIAAAGVEDVRFINAAWSNAALQARLGGLSGNAGYHLRPGVGFSSTGDLTVAGDINLESLRSAGGPGAAATEPGALFLRAAGNLQIFGSITDGFGAPIDPAAKRNPDDNGWFLLKGAEPTGQNVVVPTAVSLAAGTSFDTTTNATLTYPITIGKARLNAGIVIPTAVSLKGSYKIPTGGWVATSSIRGARGQLMFAKGSILPAGTLLHDVSLEAGAVLPFSVTLSPGTVWPAGTTLADFLSTSIKLTTGATVPAGGLIPSNTSLVFEGGASSIQLRTPANGVQGSIYATAPLDQTGQSWSIHLVGGADLASADSLAVLAPSLIPASSTLLGGMSGNIVLSDFHYINAGNTKSVQPALSVIRTGTGDLSLTAGGSVRTESLYGIYTAGVQSGDVSDSFNVARGVNQGFGLSTVLSITGAPGVSNGTNGYNYNSLLGGYQAWYPTGGGNVSISAQADVTGRVVTLQAPGLTTYTSDAVGNWLWRQGGSAGQPVSWWINFGAYGDAVNGTLELFGFSGFGTLGGGNVSVRAGRNAGNIVVNQGSQLTTSAIDVVAGSTGRVTGGTILATGGGDVDVSVGGTLNPAFINGNNNGLGLQLFGVIGSTRGNVGIEAGAIGRVVPSTRTLSAGPIVQNVSDAYGGPLLLLGDAKAAIATSADLVLGGVIDPTRASLVNQTPWTRSVNGVATVINGGGNAAFSSWTATTAIEARSAGGTLVPSLDVSGTNLGSDMNILYPPTLVAVASTGNIIYGASSGGSGNGSTTVSQAIELAPSPVGQFEFLAGGSIIAAGLSTRVPLAFDMSGASTAVADLAGPLNPAFSGGFILRVGVVGHETNVTNKYDYAGFTSLFAFAPDTATGALHANDPVPARIYAAGGDIVDLQFGEAWRFVSGSNTLANWYLAAKPALIQASRDIINAGNANLLPIADAAQPGSVLSTRNLLFNNAGGDVSVVSAGRDVFYGNFDIAGPGMMEVAAGRNLFQADQGSLYSLGKVDGSSSGGAGILMMAGLAQNVPDWQGLQALYLGTLKSGADGSVTYVAPNVAGVGQPSVTYSPRNGEVVASTTLASGASLSPTVKRNPPAAGQSSACVTGVIVCDNHSIPTGAGLSTVAQSYADQLVAWMRANEGFAAPAAQSAQVTQADALARFAGLPLYQRIPFLMTIYNTELSASGLEQSGALAAGDARYSPTSPQRSGSLARGHEVHAALVPDPAVASPATAANSITLYGGSGVSTAFGGVIEAFAPGGRLVLGLSNLTPPTPASGQPAAGLITFGSGDVDVATYGSVLLGQSRIFTTYGGAINIWSQGGDINAGTGSKTTSVYQPPKIAYDSFGNITLSPTAPTTGAGIATLAPVAGVPAGDVILVVELGVIDTGEAGIRSSGRTSFTGTVVGTGGVTASGGSFGLPSVSVPNVGALAAASSASAGASASANASDGNRRTATQSVPSIITVEVVSFGGDISQ